MRCKEALKILKCHKTTLYGYVRNGIVRRYPLGNKHFEYDDNDIYKFLGMTKEEIQMIGHLTLAYVRVANDTAEDMTLLEEQRQRIITACRLRDITIDKVFEEVGSALDSDRPKLQEVLSLIFERKVDRLVLYSTDRLVRFDYDLLKWIFKQFGTKILVLYENASETPYIKEMKYDIHEYIDNLHFEKHRKEKREVWE